MIAQQARAGDVRKALYRKEDGVFGRHNFACEPSWTAVDIHALARGSTEVAGCLFSAAAYSGAAARFRYRSNVARPHVERYGGGIRWTPLGGIWPSSPAVFNCCSTT